MRATPKRVLCDYPSLDNLLKCAFILGDLELRIFHMLLDEDGGKEVTVDQIAEIVGKSRVTVYKALERLASSGLVSKEKRSLERGGYYYAYRLIPREELRKRLREFVETWYRAALDVIEREL